MKKTTFIYILLIVLCAGLYIVISTTQKMSDVTMKVAITPPESGRTYYFILKDDGTLIVSEGAMRSQINFNAILFARTFPRRVHNETGTQLAVEEYLHLVNIADTLPIDGYITEMYAVHPVGMADILYNGAIYGIFYRSPVLRITEEPYEAIRSLVNEFIRLSPIEVRFPVGYPEF